MSPVAHAHHHLRYDLFVVSSSLPVIFYWRRPALLSQSTSVNGSRPNTLSESLMQCSNSEWEVRKGGKTRQHLTSWVLLLSLPMTLSQPSVLTHVQGQFRLVQSTRWCTHNLLPALFRWSVESLSGPPTYTASIKTHKRLCGHLYPTKKSEEHHLYPCTSYQTRYSRGITLTLLFTTVVPFLVFLSLLICLVRSFLFLSCTLCCSLLPFPCHAWRKILTPHRVNYFHKSLQNRGVRRWDAFIIELPQ